MQPTKAEVHGPCTGCGTETERHANSELICLECEMTDFARHCADTHGIKPADALQTYLDRPATDKEADAFTRHYLQATRGRE